FKTMKEENSEALETLLEQYQITEDGFKEQLRFELIMDEFLSKTIDVDVSDDDVKEFYEEAKEEAKEGDDEGEIPEFDEVKDQSKESMEQEAMTLALQDKVDEIKETAEIERKIQFFEKVQVDTSLFEPSFILELFENFNYYIRKESREYGEQKYIILFISSNRLYVICIILWSREFNISRTFRTNCRR